jgi:hypothetical protein
MISHYAGSLARGSGKIKEGNMGKEPYAGLNLMPPEEGFELYRHKNAEQMPTQGWSGLYWARRNEEGDYEIRSVTREGEGHSVTGGFFPKEGFEEHYERTRR